MIFYKFKAVSKLYFSARSFHSCVRGDLRSHALILQENSIEGIILSFPSPSDQTVSAYSPYLVS